MGQLPGRSAGNGDGRDIKNPALIIVEQDFFVVRREFSAAHADRFHKLLDGVLFDRY